MTRMTARAARALDKIPYASNRRGKWENKWEDKWEHKWEHTWEHRWEDKDKWETWDRWKRAPSGTDDNTAVTRVVAAPLSARLCAHIVRGARCPLGAACPFAHTAAELPDKYKTTACNKWARRAACCYGERCQFVHGASDAIARAVRALREHCAGADADADAVNREEPVNTSFPFLAAVAVPGPVPAIESIKEIAEGGAWSSVAARTRALRGRPEPSPPALLARRRPLVLAKANPANPANPANGSTNPCREILQDDREEDAAFALVLRVVLFVLEEDVSVDAEMSST